MESSSTAQNFDRLVGAAQTADGGSETPPRPPPSPFTVHARIDPRPGSADVLLTLTYRVFSKKNTEIQKKKEKKSSFRSSFERTNTKTAGCKHHRAQL